MTTKKTKTRNKKEQKQETRQAEPQKLLGPGRSETAIKQSKLPIIFVSFIAITFVVFGYINKDANKSFLTETSKNSEIMTENTANETKTSIKDYVSPYKTPPPDIMARAYSVTNQKNNLRMYAKNPSVPYPPASVTKIMTAIVALEEFSLSKPVVIPEKCVKIEGSKVGFDANDVLTLEDVLYGVLVSSGADAACSIASINDEADFVDKMNKKATELGMTGTIYGNEIGFDQGEYQFSTIDDLEKLAKYALNSSIFRKIVGTREVTLHSLNSTNYYKVTNTNELLFTIPGTVGIKTGYTDDAKECLAYLYENQGAEIMIIILGSEDRFSDTTTLLNWAKDQL